MLQIHTTVKHQDNYDGFSLEAKSNCVDDFRKKYREIVFINVNGKRTEDEIFRFLMSRYRAIMTNSTFYQKCPNQGLGRWLGW